MNLLQRLFALRQQRALDPRFNQMLLPAQRSPLQSFNLPPKSVGLKSSSVKLKERHRRSRYHQRPNLCSLASRPLPSLPKSFVCSLLGLGLQLWI